MRGLQGLEIALVFAFLSFAGPAFASPTEYRSVVVDKAILYDAPSERAGKKFLLSRYSPAEVVVNLGNWIKIRDRSGGLYWTPSKNLGTARTVVVIANLADVRQAPDANAPIVFQAERDVALELVEIRGAWLKVKHRDGQTGYVLASQMWGA